MADVETIVTNISGKSKDKALPLLASSGDAPLVTIPNLLSLVDRLTPSQYALRNFPESQGEMDAVQTFLHALEPRMSELASNKEVGEHIADKLRDLISRHPHLDSGGAISRLLERIICETPAVRYAMYAVAQLPLQSGAEILHKYTQSSNFKVESGRDVIGAINNMLQKIRNSNATLVGYPGWEQEVKELLTDIIRRYNKLPPKDKNNTAFQKDLSDLSKIHPQLAPIIDEAKTEAKNPPRVPTPKAVPIQQPPAQAAPVAAPVAVQDSTVDTDTDTENGGEDDGIDMTDAMKDLLATLNSHINPSGTDTNIIDPAEAARQAVEAQISEYMDNDVNAKIYTDILGPLGAEQQNILRRAVGIYIQNGHEPARLHPRLFAEILNGKLRNGDPTTITDQELGQLLYDYEKRRILNKKVEAFIETHVQDKMQREALPQLGIEELATMETYFMTCVLHGAEPNMDCAKVVGVYPQIESAISKDWPNISPIEKQCLRGIYISQLLDSGVTVINLSRVDAQTELNKLLKPVYIKKKVEEYMTDHHDLFVGFDDGKKEYIAGALIADAMKRTDLSRPLSVDGSLLSALREDPMFMSRAAADIVKVRPRVESLLQTYSTQLPQDKYERAYLKDLLLAEALRKQQSYDGYRLHGTHKASMLEFTHQEFHNCLATAQKISAVEHARTQTQQMLKSKVIDYMDDNVLPELDRKTEMRVLRGILAQVGDRVMGNDISKPLNEREVEQVLEAQTPQLREMMFEVKYEDEADKELNTYDAVQQRNNQPSLDKTKEAVVKAAIINYKKARKPYNIAELALAA